MQRNPICAKASSLFPLNKIAALVQDLLHFLFAFSTKYYALRISPIALFLSFLRSHNGD